MPICIECRHPVKTLWTKYSNADDKSSGHNIRLTVCRNCGQFCDKYVEHDFVVLFIDLVLIKPQVYRHLLHNTLMKDDDRFDYDVPAAARSLGWAVVANNVEALRILLDCGYGVATLLATTGALARWSVGRGIFWAAGLDGVDSIGETSIAADGKALWALLMHVREWASDLAAG
ncbi:hypothetical protein KNSL1_005272 [Colletotrichum chrysophilum]|nr:hypothetical protein KNSL1_005272 [Colletotrichum chrysophilum]